MTILSELKIRGILGQQRLCAVCRQYEIGTVEVLEFMMQVDGF